MTQAPSPSDALGRRAAGGPAERAKRWHGGPARESQLPDDVDGSRSTTRSSDELRREVLHGLQDVARLLRRPGAVALTGAGMSTDSGIPDYRGPDGVRRITPMTIGEFRSGADARRRYWARSYVGWRRFRAAEPNRAHWALAQLQRHGRLGDVITQNVDGLHQRAGTRSVVELHGSLDRVVCLQCGCTTGRADLDRQMSSANPHFAQVADGMMRPDGDVDLPAHAVANFVAPACEGCASDLLKPDVVFFGESVPKPLVQRCFDSVERASALIVFGSSLQVMSGLRFVRRAAATHVPVAIVTRGRTRGDDLADVRVDAALGEVIPALAQMLTPGAAPQ